ncbi:not available [Pontoporia blainvillei]|uniref:Not available n=1 Tax=Pontoporia blainvillei TaxID=48723 RepID=A0ABX0S8Z2_PONBL|nr:not available [Pontoporia blainvillei]
MWASPGCRAQESAWRRCDLKDQASGLSDASRKQPQLLGLGSRPSTTCSQAGPQPQSHSPERHALKCNARSLSPVPCDETGSPLSIESVSDSDPSPEHRASHLGADGLMTAHGEEQENAGGACTLPPTLSFSVRNYDLDESSLPRGYHVFSSPDPERGILPVSPAQTRGKHKRQGNVSCRTPDMASYLSSRSPAAGGPGVTSRSAGLNERNGYS